MGTLWGNSQDFVLYCLEYLKEGLSNQDIHLRRKSTILIYQKQLAKIGITKCY